MRDKGAKLAAFAKKGRPRWGRYGKQRKPDEAIHERLKHHAQKIKEHDRDVTEEGQEALVSHKAHAQMYAQELRNRGHGSIQTGKHGGLYYVSRSGEKHYLGKDTGARR